MRKFGIIIDEIIHLAEKANEDIKGIRTCRGRAQLLSYISNNFDNLYSKGIINLELLHEMYNEEELNRRRIYTIGEVRIDKECGSAFICGETKAVVIDTIVRAYDCSKVRCIGNSTCFAKDNVELELNGCSHGFAWGKAIVQSRYSSTISCYGNNKINAEGLSVVNVNGPCSVDAKGHTTIFAYNNTGYNYSPCIKLREYAICRHNGGLIIKILSHSHSLAINELTHEVQVGELKVTEK